MVIIDWTDDLYWVYIGNKVFTYATREEAQEVAIQAIYHDQIVRYVGHEEDPMDKKTLLFHCYQGSVPHRGYLVYNATGQDNKDISIELNENGRVLKRLTEKRINRRGIPLFAVWERITKIFYDNATMIIDRKNFLSDIARSVDFRKQFEVPILNPLADKYTVLDIEWIDADGVYDGYLEYKEDSCIKIYETGGKEVGKHLFARDLIGGSEELYEVWCIVCIAWYIQRSLRIDSIDDFLDVVCMEGEG